MERYFFLSRDSRQVLELQADEMRANGDMFVLRVDGQIAGELRASDFAGWITNAVLPTIHSPLPESSQ